MAKPLHLSSSDDTLAEMRSHLGVTVTPVVPPKLNKVQKAEGEVLRSNAVSLEDTMFSEFYQEGAKVGLVRPTLDPVHLAFLTHQNNALAQCISVMEVNIDGTGYEIERKDGEVPTEEDESAIENLKAFFDEPYPGKTGTQFRKALRRDLEETGTGYIEVVRNAAGDIVFMRHMQAKLTRLVRLDEPVPVERMMERNGQEVKATIFEQERRYAQVQGKTLVYFKEFGASRDVERTTGKWKENLNQEEKGTEVIMLRVLPDVATEYGVPRWVNQIPSVLGSRKAEELNLEFFNSGGIPPAMIFVQGGELGSKARAELTAYLAGVAKYKQRAVVAEVFSTSGSIESAGSVKVSVERFGAERQSDSMFENYDARCFERVRSAFRIPPLFLGKSEDYNFATAKTSYMVAEAQVFKPEREEYDEVINSKIMAEIAPEYVFRSQPMTVNDIENQLKGIELVREMVDDENLLDTINNMTHLALQMKEEEETLPEDEIQNRLNELRSGLQPEQVVDVEVEKGEITNVSGMFDLEELSGMWAQHLTGQTAFDPEMVESMEGVINHLAASTKRLFHTSVATKIVGPEAHDPEGVGTLLGCAASHRGG